MKATHSLCFALAVLIVAAFLIGDDKDKGPLSGISSDGVHIAPQSAKIREASVKTESVFGSEEVEEQDGAAEYARSSVSSEAQNPFSESQRDADEIRAQWPALTAAGDPVPRPQTQYIER